MHGRRQSGDRKAICADLRKLLVVVPKKHRVREHRVSNRVSSHKDKTVHIKSEDLPGTRAQHRNEPRTLVQINPEQQEKNPQQIKPRRLHQSVAEPSTRFRLLRGRGQDLRTGSNIVEKERTSDQGLLE